RLEGVATGLRTCQDPHCQTIAGLYNQLVLGLGNQAIPSARRNTAEWEAKFEEALQTVTAWKESTHTTPAGFYREKAFAYLALLVLAPPAHQAPVLRAIIAFVAQNPLQKSNRIEWFLPVNGLIGRVGLDPLGLGKFAEEL